jgi:phosphoglucomutase
MKIDPRAGQLATATDLVDVPKLIAAYYEGRPDAEVAEQRVIFGTSGHRGSSFTHTFNEWHILAITQAICIYRAQQKIDGPLFLGIDTHALSHPAVESALEVLAANAVDVMLAGSEQYTPTPVISHAILAYNRGARPGLAMASSSHHRTILRIAAGSSTTRLMAGPRKRRSPRGSRDRPTSFLSSNLKGSSVSPSTRR